MIWVAALVAYVAGVVLLARFLADRDLTQGQKDQRELKRYNRYLKAMSKIRKS